MIDFKDPVVIQAIVAGLTVFITLIVIIILFLENKKRKSEIESLVSINKSQEEMNNNFINQLDMMQKQIVQLVESNEILKQQVLNTLKYYKSTMEIFQEKPTIEKVEKRRKIGQQFAFEGSTGNRETHKVKIKNKGETVYNINITYPQNESIEFSSKNSTIDKIDKNYSFALEGKVLNRVQLPQYVIQIEFEDENKNKYCQMLSTMKMKKDASLPVLIKN